MKLNKKIIINNTEYKIVSEMVTLELFSAGLAIFVIQAENEVFGKCEFFLGYNGEYSIYLTGYIDECYQIDKKQQRILIRENAAVLRNWLPLSLKNVTAEETILEAANITGLEFIAEENDWNNVTIPNVVNSGSGFALLDFLGKELRIDNYCYLQTPTGKIYIGNWESSSYGNVYLQLPIELAQHVSVIGCTMPIVPKYRPGAKVKIGTNDYVYITKVEISGEAMRINWHKDPF